jgi:hypothetical protein
MVRVWLGKYDAGTSILANYATQAVSFDLTTIRNGVCSIDNDLSQWFDLSPNGSIAPSFASLQADLLGTPHQPNLYWTVPPSPMQSEKAPVSDFLGPARTVAVSVVFKTALCVAALTCLCILFVQLHSFVFVCTPTACNGWLLRC